MSGDLTLANETGPLLIRSGQKKARQSGQVGSLVEESETHFPLAERRVPIRKAAKWDKRPSVAAFIADVQLAIGTGTLGPIAF